MLQCWLARAKDTILNDCYWNAKKDHTSLYITKQYHCNWKIRFLIHMMTLKSGKKKTITKIFSAEIALTSCRVMLNPSLFTCLCMWKDTEVCKQKVPHPQASSNTETTPHFYVSMHSYHFYICNYSDPHTIKEQTSMNYNCSLTKIK